MNSITGFEYKRVIRGICDLPWESLDREDMVAAAWAYYYFSVQFREGLETALMLHPEDEKLQHLKAEECDTDNLSPWPGVVAPGERVNHDEFMRRTIALEPMSPARAHEFRSVGENYLDRVRSLPLTARASAIASYEDEGLELVFTAMLRFQHWDTPLLRAFQHFLAEHVRFDSDPDQGHGALSRHLQPDDRVLPLWEEFFALFVNSVPGLAREAITLRSDA